MLKEWDDFEKNFKKLQQNTKSMKPADGEKIKKQLISDLNKAWDEETLVRKAIKKAQENGVKGDKLSALQKDANFASAYKNWKKATAEHKEQVNSLQKFSDEAKKHHDSLNKMYQSISKTLKSSKPTDAEKKKTAAVMKEAQAELEALAKMKAIYGTLKMPELFYASKEEKTMEVIIKKQVAKSAPAALPKVLEDKARKKAEKDAKALYNNALNCFREAIKDSKINVEFARTDINKGEAMAASLTKLNDGFQNAKKKQFSEIDKAPNKKEIEATINTINGYKIEIDKLQKKAKTAVAAAEKG